MSIIKTAIMLLVLRDDILLFISDLSYFNASESLPYTNFIVWLVGRPCLFRLLPMLGTSLLLAILSFPIALLFPFI